MSIIIHLEGDGLNYERKDLSITQALQVMTCLTTTGPGQGQMLNMVSENTPGSTHSSAACPDNRPCIFGSPQEAITKMSAMTNPQKIAAIAAYLGATSTNGKTVTREDIQDGFRKSGESMPKNIGRDLRQAIRCGFLCLEDDRSYRVLKTVDEAVQNGRFAASGPRTKRKKTARASKTENFQPGESGHPTSSSVEGVQE